MLTSLILLLQVASRCGAGAGGSQEASKDGSPTEVRRGRRAEQEVIRALIGGDRNARQQ
jgi:hypothetical protein